MLWRNKKEKREQQQLFRSVTAASVLAAMLLSGCGAQTQAADPGQQAQETLPAYTVPADGEPGTPACRGSYTAEVPAEEVVASVGDRTLSNGELNVYYRLAINSFRGETAPDWTVPLEGQLKSPEDGTWQQYFLARALDSWHTAAALEQKSYEKRLRHEECFQSDPEFHEKYMGHVPAIKVLYSMDNTFKPNRMHQDFLDGIPDLLEKLAREKGYSDTEAMLRAEFGLGTDLDTAVRAIRTLNWAYMFYTDLSYDVEPEPEDILAAMTGSGETLVDLRHILLRPEGGTLDDEGRVTATEEQWEACRREGEKLLRKWNSNMRSEARFAIQAHDLSQDSYTALNGGLYAQVRKGQLVEPLNSWCFDPEREPEDTELKKSDYGYHILYFCGEHDEAYEQTRLELIAEELGDQTRMARQDYPMEVSYEKIQLAPVQAPGKLKPAEDLLYADVAHERISEVPVYIQQDYRKAPYGGHTVSSHGCGITSLAMLSTYMADTILTPGMLADRYARYGSNQGTDSGVFYYTPPEMGFYVHSHAFEWKDAEQALREGRKVVNLQHKGYFTRGGHYLVLSEMAENGNIVIRDSNIYNYKRLEEHSRDNFPGEKIVGSAQGYWIYDYKILNTPFCSRCGDAPVEHPWDVTDAPQLLQQDYLCPKCRTALARRNGFLSLTGLDG